MREGGYFTYSSTVSLIKKELPKQDTPNKHISNLWRKAEKIRTLVISRKIKQISEVSKHMKSRRE
jgi:hypothetical protein